MGVGRAMGMLIKAKKSKASVCFPIAEGPLRCALRASIGMAVCHAGQHCRQPVLAKGSHHNASQVKTPLCLFSQLPPFCGSEGRVRK